MKTLGKKRHFKGNTRVLDGSKKGIETLDSSTYQQQDIETLTKLWS